MNKLNKWTCYIQKHLTRTVNFRVDTENLMGEYTLLLDVTNEIKLIKILKGD